VGRNPKFSQNVIPLFGNDAGIPKGAATQKGKTHAIQKYSDSNLETSWTPLHNPENYTSVIPKMG